MNIMIVLTDGWIHGPRYVMATPSLGKGEINLKVTAVLVIWICIRLDLLVKVVPTADKECEQLLNDLHVQPKW